MSKASSKNMRLIAQRTPNGLGNMDEGMSMEVTAEGIRAIWLGNETPLNFTQYRCNKSNNPKMVLQTELFHQQVRSNTFELNTIAYSVFKSPEELRVGKIQINVFTLTSARFFEGQNGFLLVCIFC